MNVFAKMKPRWRSDRINLSRSPMNLLYMLILHIIRIEMIYFHAGETCDSTVQDHRQNAGKYGEPNLQLHKCSKMNSYIVVGTKVYRLKWCLPV